MTTHPALQPRLDRSKVKMMLSYLVAERDEARQDAATLRAAADYALATEQLSYARGLDRAVEVVTDMWAAAVIATAALADELAAALDDMADELDALADEDDEGVEDDD